MRLGAFLAVLLVIAGITSNPAAARQGYLDFLPPLTKEDMELIKQQSRVEMAGKPVGTILKWSNPDSGNHGIVTLKGRHELNGRECRDLVHGLRIKGEANARRYAVTICRMEDGSWKFP